MSAFDYDILDDDFDNERKSRRKNSGDEWILSFADVVTVLLCFFIIFYVVEKQLEKKGFGFSKGETQEYKTKMSTPEVQSLIETFKSLPDVIVLNTDKFLEVHFPPEMFFAIGSTSLTKEGQKMIDQIIPSLSIIKEGYHLQIQGYTDDSKVLSSDKRWWQDNMQLSVERSLKVYYHLINSGVEKKILTVTGFGASKPLLNEAQSMQRRISFKFEPALYENEKK